MAKERKFWVDSTTVALLSDAKTTMEELFKQGYKGVIPTILDIEVFQRNKSFIEDCLQNDKIQIELWTDGDQMVAKDFYWSSCGVMTKAASSLEEAVKDLPNRAEILAMNELQQKYGIPRGEWTAGAWAPPEPLSEELQQKLGLPADTTRSAVLEACMKLDDMEDYDKFNMGYVRGLAHQHSCTLFLNSMGEIVEI